MADNEKDMRTEVGTVVEKWLRSIGATGLCYRGADDEPRCRCWPEDGFMQCPALPALPARECTPIYDAVGTTKWEIACQCPRCKTEIPLEEQLSCHRCGEVYCASCSDAYNACSKCDPTTDADRKL